MNKNEWGHCSKYLKEIVRTDFDLKPGPRTVFTALQYLLLHHTEKKMRSLKMIEKYRDIVENEMQFGLLTFQDG